MLRQTIFILLFLPQLLFSQTSDLPFQVLIAQDAYIYGKAIGPLTYVDDVTSIDVKPGGFLALVHKGGTTYELKEKIFTFYLKPEELKEQAVRSEIKIYMKTHPGWMKNTDLLVIHPIFSEEGIVKWEAKTPFEFYWYLPNEIAHTFKVNVSDHAGKKIQEFGTSKNSFVLKPYNFGLEEDEFVFQVTRRLLGDVLESPEYRIKLSEAPAYPTKASDLVLKALNLERLPKEALEVWKEILGMENGKYYFVLFEKFIKRNESVLTDAREDIEQLLSQNK